MAFSSIDNIFPIRSEILAQDGARTREHSEKFGILELRSDRAGPEPIAPSCPPFLRICPIRMNRNTDRLFVRFTTIGPFTYRVQTEAARKSTGSIE